MSKTILATVLVWLPAVALSAQVLPPPPAPSTKPSAAAAPSFTFEQIHTRVRFDNDGTARREQTLGIKVLDEQAVRQFGEFPLAYQSDSEALDVTNVSVEKPDGSIVPTPASSIQDVAAVPAGQLPMFVDVRQKIVSVTALRPGDVLRVTGVWTVTKPIAPGQFWFEYAFDRKNAVADEQLEIDVPAARAVSLKVASGVPAEEHGGQGSVDAGRRVYRWKTSHPQAETGADTIQPGDEEPAPDIRLSSFRTWQEFARWFTPLAFPAPDAAVKARAQALTANAPDEAAKIAAIYRFVSTDIRYVSLSFGLGRFAAHAPADVLKTQYGDCKDKAVLTRALLEAVGVHAVPVLVNTTRSIDGDFASPLEFDHMIALVPRGQPPAGAWMDATLEVAPLGLLSPSTRDRRVLVLPGDGTGMVVRTPADPAVPNESDFSVDGAINAIGVLDAKVTLTTRGDPELIARSVVRAMPRTSLKDFVSAIAAANAIDGEISEPDTTDPADVSSPFRITFRQRLSGALDWAAARSQLKIGERVKLPYADEADRKDLHRLRFDVSTSRERVSIELPAGYSATAPQPVSVSRAGVDYASTYRTEGRRLIVERTTKVTVRELPESAFGEYASAVSAIDADSAQQFSVNAAATGTPTVPADATSAEIYAAANSAWGAKRYEAAGDLFKRATEVAPKMGDAWIGLGLAYNKLGRYEEAAAAIQKQIDLDPYNKRAHGDLGLVFKNAGKTDEAIKAYARQTELNALDGSAFKELGSLYVDDGRDTDAIPVLEKALGLLPRDAWVPANLVTAYLETKQPEKAQEAVARVLERDPNAAVREYVGWQLAQHGIDLARAEELSRDAEKRFVDDLRGLETTKSVTATTLEYVERLGWTWDAIGWIDFQRGKYDEADGYLEAAWHLLGVPEIAYRLGQVCAKRDKLADAMSYYLTAEALNSAPPPDLVARVKKLAGGGDLPLMLKSARQSAAAERALMLGPSADTGVAYFLAIVDGTRKALDVTFLSGAEALRPLADGAVRKAVFPVLLRAGSPARVAVRVHVVCSAGVCRGGIESPLRARTDTQLPSSSQ